jgi:hypothetical protein
MDSRVLYKVNEGFRQYVTKYCRKHECTVEESFTHSIVQSAAEYYESAELGKISVSEVKAGCSGAVSGGDCK